jgi:AcrR family transcriptional regulator
LATRETQTLILEAATELFNEHGTRAVSTNRIADDCELSRGNLHYHFRTKEEIIQTIFQRIDQEMKDSWYDEVATPTLAQTNFMFERQMKLCWRYRFFYRELIALLQNDARLKILFVDSRSKRLVAVRRFFNRLIEHNLMRLPDPPITLDSLLLTSWLVTDQWLPHLDMYDISASDHKAIREGGALILNIFMPFFTQKGLAELARLNA